MGLGPAAEELSPDGGHHGGRERAFFDNVEEGLGDGTAEEAVTEVAYAFGGAGFAATLTEEVGVATHAELGLAEVGGEGGRGGRADDAPSHLGLGVGGVVGEGDPGGGGRGGGSVLRVQRFDRVVQLAELGGVDVVCVNAGESGRGVGYIRWGAGEAEIARVGPRGVGGWGEAEESGVADCA